MIELDIAGFSAVKIVVYAPLILKGLEVVGWASNFSFSLFKVLDGFLNVNDPPNELFVVVLKSILFAVGMFVPVNGKIVFFSSKGDYFFLQP